MNERERCRATSYLVGGRYSRYAAGTPVTVVTTAANAGRSVRVIQGGGTDEGGRAVGEVFVCGCLRCVVYAQGRLARKYLFVSLCERLLIFLANWKTAAVKIVIGSCGSILWHVAAQYDFFNCISHSDGKSFFYNCLSISLLAAFTSKSPRFEGGFELG